MQNSLPNNQIEQISAEAIIEFQKNPGAFFEEILGAKCEPYQLEILKSVESEDRVAVSACHSVGKSWSLARTVLWYMACFPGAKVVTTAPTHRQVKDILWAELRTAYSRSKFPLGGKMNLTEWMMSPDGDWKAVGFSPRNEISGEEGQGSASHFQGFHSSNFLLVFDEATGVPHSTWVLAEGLMTSQNVKFIAIGNPTSRNSDFYKCFQSPEWKKINLSCFDSPNLRINGITNIDELRKEVELVRGLSDFEAQSRMRAYKFQNPYLISLKWVVSMALPRKWGLDHPLFVSKILGQFPKDSDNALIPLWAVEDAQLRITYPSTSDRRVIGVDVARFGSDETVITWLHGKKQMGIKALIKQDTAQVVGEIIALYSQFEADVIVIDETGLGGGVVDMLNEAHREKKLGHKTEIRGVQFGAVAGDDAEKEKFVNLKARMFGLLRDDMKASDGLSLLNEDVYLDELPTLLYHYDSKGKLRIESKDDYKKRTGRKSPDAADSLALANFGRYDAIEVGRFPEIEAQYGKPFAASLGSGAQW